MTTNHWVIAPVNPANVKLFERSWGFDYQNGLIAIGWPDLGDVSRLSRQDLVERIRQVYGNKMKRAHITIWRFWHEIKTGDKVIAKRGIRKMLAVGTVTREAFYDEILGKERVAGLTDDFFPNFIGVEWERREFEFPERTFAIGTLHSIPAERYHQIIDASARPWE